MGESTPGLLLSVRLPAPALGDNAADVIAGILTDPGRFPSVTIPPQG